MLVTLSFSLDCCVLAALALALGGDNENSRKSERVATSNIR